MSLVFPKRTDAWRAILDASCIDSYDYDRADAIFAVFVGNRRGTHRPPAWEGGEMDAVNCHLGRTGDKRVAGPLHGFYLLTRGAKTWADAIPALSVLRGVPGLEKLRLPDDVMAELVEQIEYWRDVERMLLAA